MRTILKNTGIPQGGDVSKHIGPFQNMLAAFNLMQQTLNSESFSENSIYIYPNPSNGFVSIVSSNSDSIFILNLVEIFDITGKVVWCKKDLEIINNNSIDLTFLNKGMYFIKITINNQSILKKIIF